jgi:magnesium-protoporphyrin O-methyltransferase
MVAQYGLFERRVLISFAPKTYFICLVEEVRSGELFPGPSRRHVPTARGKMLCAKALQDAGFEVARDEMTGTNFTSRLLRRSDV